jgi:hypothetical protein
MNRHFLVMLIFAAIGALLLWFITGMDVCTGSVICR